MKSLNSIGMKKSVYLRAFELSDLDLLNQWHNDDDLNLLTGGRKYFVSSELDRKWLEDKMNNNTTQIYCAICDMETHKIIGSISLNNIDFINRNAFWGGIVIGESSNRNISHSVQAVYQMLDHGFSQLNLHKIYGHWLEDNKASLLLGEIFKFKNEGLLRDHVFKNNKFNNVVVKSLLKSEFEENKQEYLNI